ncbi:MAG: Ig-like domain-containing protein [Fibrobacteria bacterium]|nr:Ig-like domain-containing protein [Fibrobacteria bacterium]
MTDRIFRSWLALSLALAGCARVVPPAGGPQDLTPPRLVRSSPEPGAVGVDRSSVIVLEFSEWVDPATLKPALSLMPAPSRSPEILVDGPEVRLKLREPLDSATTVVLRLGTGISDFRQAAGQEVVEIPFATGPALDSGNLAVEVWQGSDSTLPVRARARVGLYALDTLRRSGLARLLRRRDSLAWLAGAPSPWREKAWRWAETDSTGTARFRHLPPGRWRVVAWLDRDRDGYWRPLEEPVAWVGDLAWTDGASSASFLARLGSIDTIEIKHESSPQEDSLRRVRDQARRTRDSLRELSPQVREERRREDSVARRTDSLRRVDSTRLDSLASLEATWPDDSVRVLHLDATSAGFSATDTLVLRLLRKDAKRRPLVVRGPGDRLVARVPRGSSWGGEVWRDTDGDGRPSVGDPVRLLSAEPWRALAEFRDEKESDVLEAPLSLAPSSDAGVTP